jgi:SAM-dependent methyltransferase
MHQLSPYDRLAGVYNRHLAGFGRRVLPVLVRLGLGRLPRGARVLDLCCGTGQLAALLSQQGYRVSGLDSSAGMLEFARRNVPTAEFVMADARDFSLPCRFDAALSVHDSINHFLSAGELIAVLANVRSALCAGGSFAFDANMEPLYATRWNGGMRAMLEDEVCELRASWDAQARLGRNQATFFPRGGGNATDEITVLERCYSEQEIRSALAEAGFAAVSSYDAEAELGMAGEFGRRIFVAS